jgi:hypothetical protein
MKKSTVYFLLLFSGFVSKSQEHLQIFQDTVNEDNLLKISSLNHYSSNRFNNAYLDKFLFGGNIDQQLKDNNFNRLKTVNVIGGEFEQRIDSYTPTIHPLKKEKYGLVLSFSDNHLLSATVPKDLYTLAMYGNADYVGDTLNLSYGHAQYQHYQKMSVGFYEKKTMSSIQLSYVAGSRAFDFYTTQSFLWTHAANDSIEFQAQGQGFSTDSLAPYFAFQGSGFSLDISYNFIFNSKKGDRQIVNFKLSNAGAIFWNKNSNKYSVDTNIKYGGFDIADFINQDSLTGKWNFEDTLGIVQAKTNYSEALPVELSIEKMADAQGKKLQAIFGFKAILTQDYRPYFYGGIHYRPVQYFSASTYFSYGGFAGLRWGLYCNFNAGKKIRISLGTADMIGNISKNYGFGRSANLMAVFKL